VDVGGVAFSVEYVIQSVSRISLCGAVCCSVLQFRCMVCVCVSLCWCSVLQCVAVCCSVLQCVAVKLYSLQVSFTCGVLQCVAVSLHCLSVHFLACCRVLMCVAEC